MFHEKHFSVEEAENLLPDLKIKLSKIIELKRTLDERGYDINRHQYFGGIGANGTGRFPDDMEELVKLVHQISEKGIIVKGIDNGLIDFPHLRENGEEVYLCFLLGEEKINFWHGINDGFMGRRNLEDL